MATIAEHSATRCPGREILLAFSGGRLPPPEIESIGWHLNGCETCLAFLDSQTDPEFGRSILGLPMVSAAEKDSEKSSLGDTAFSRLRGDSEFQRMKAKARQIDIQENGATVAWNPPAELLRKTADEVLPEKIGRYFVLKKLGRGGFANVYLARDPEQNRLVAIKVPRADKLASPVQIEEFLREARTAATLDHPHIVPVFDFDRLGDGGCYVVMKYIEGRSLESAMESERFSFERAAEMCAQIADALEYAHQRKFVHRDIKPANILLDNDGLAYVADFGLAIHEDTQHRHKDERAGTWSYMSPEQIRGESHHLDARTDVWSLGVVLYEILTRQKPFPSKNKSDLEEEIQFREPKPLRSIDRRIPEELERVCLQSLVKSVAARCPSAAAMADELRRPSRLAEFLEEAPKPTPARSRLAYWAAGVVTLALAMILLSIGIWMNKSRAREPGRWYSLLDQKPQSLVISEIAADTNWRFDPKVPEIVINSGHPVAIGVGQTDSQNFLIEIRIVKTNWQGTAGLFWGMHDGETSDGLPSLRYQTLVIQSHLEDGRVTYRLERKFMESWVPGTAPATGRETYLMEEVESPDSSEILLKITVIEGKVMEISWNGKARPGVCDSPGIRSPNSLISAGKLGLYNENGTAIFRDVRLQILPTAKRPSKK